MVDSYFVEAWEYANDRGKKLLALKDIDFAMLPGMYTDTTPEQKQYVSDWYDLSEGGVFFITGRGHKSVDKSWGRSFPGSFEHHSCMRVADNGGIIALAPPINTTVLGRKLKTAIEGVVDVTNDQSKVRPCDGNKIIAYVEVKEFSVALDHSVGLGDEAHKNVQDLLENNVALPVLRDMGVMETHEIVRGKDAVEIVPRLPSLSAEAQELLSEKERVRISNDGLNKGTAVHNIMSLMGAESYIPVMLGDSPGSDGYGFDACVEYGGYGIAVANGNKLPDKFLQAAKGKIIPNYHNTWDHVEKMVNHLRCL